MYKYTPLSYLACLVTVFISSVGYAQNTSVVDENITEDIHPEEIVITGTRTPKLLSNSPVSVDVISHEEIELLTQGTIAQALNFIPGVVVVRNQKDGYNIQMQGFDGDNVLILLNSQPLIAPTGSAVDLDQISAHDIQQIEVIRGAASVMYGSSAMGGVINIITKEPDENRLKISYELGSYAGNEIDGDEYSHQTKLNSTYIYKGWAYQLDLMVKETPGFDYDNDESSSPAGSLDKTFVHFASSGKVDNLNVSVKYQYFEEEKDKNTGVIAGQDRYAQYLSDVDQHQLDFHIGQDVFNKAEHEIANNSWQLNARLMDHQETSGNTGSLRDADIGLYELNGQYVWSQSDKEVVAGGVVHQDTLEQVKVLTGAEEVPDQSKESAEAFAQINWIDPKYQMLLGMRGQYDSDFGDHYALRASGMINFIDKADKLQWRFGVGQGYRVPTLKERFYEFDHSALGYKVYGNEDLDPEESVSINSSFNYRTSFTKTWLGDFDLTSDINFHFTKADNLIDTFHDAERSAEEDLDISVYENVEEAEIKGIDVSTELHFTNWVGQLNYSYLDAQDNENNRLEARPYHQVKGSLGYNYSPYEIDAMLYFVYQQGEARPEDSYENGSHNNEWTTVDFKLSQQVTRHLSWRLNIENIFDEHLNDAADNKSQFDARPVSSRFVALGINYQF